mgnify:CR=1 FL=1
MPDRPRCPWLPRLPRRHRSSRSRPAGAAARGAGALPLAAASKAHAGRPPAGARRTGCHRRHRHTASSTSPSATPAAGRASSSLDLSTDPDQATFRDAGPRAKLESRARPGAVPEKLVGRRGRRRSDEAAHPRSRPVGEIHVRKRRWPDHRCSPLGPEARSRQERNLGLEKADLFNLLCVPPIKADTDIGRQTRDAAATYRAGSGAPCSSPIRASPGTARPRRSPGNNASFMGAQRRMPPCTSRSSGGGSGVKKERSRLSRRAARSPASSPAWMQRMAYGRRRPVSRRR